VGRRPAEVEGRRSVRTAPGRSHHAGRREAWPSGRRPGPHAEEPGSGPIQERRGTPVARPAAEVGLAAPHGGTTGRSGGVADREPGQRVSGPPDTLSRRTGRVAPPLDLAQRHRRAYRPRVRRLPQGRPGRACRAERGRRLDQSHRGRCASSPPGAARGGTSPAATGRSRTPRGLGGYPRRRRPFLGHRLSRFRRPRKGRRVPPGLGPLADDGIAVDQVLLRRRASRTPDQVRSLPRGL